MDWVVLDGNWSYAVFFFVGSFLIRKFWIMVRESVLGIGDLGEIAGEGASQYLC